MTDTVTSCSVPATAAKLRTQMVELRVRRVLDLYDKAIFDILKNDKPDTMVCPPTLSLQEIIGSPNLHDEVMRLVSRNLADRGFRTVEVTKKIGYLPGSKHSVCATFKAATLEIHW